jgi:RHS repeat-associated protein
MVKRLANPTARPPVMSAQRPSVADAVITAHGRSARMRSTVVRWWLAGVMAVALLVAGLQGVVAQSAAAATGRGTATAVSRMAVPASVPAAEAGMSTRSAATAEALRAARGSGVRAEIAADQTDVSQTFANPDGTFTSVVSAAPRWVRRGSSWAAADATLARRGDGSWAPEAAANGLTLSGGGGQVLATLRAGGYWMSLTWPSALPAPAVAGASATYRDVFPGVDLVVTADTAGGLDETLVVRDKAAAADPQLAALTLGVSASAGLSQRAGADGSVAMVTAGGTAVFSSPPPLAWNSTSAGAGVSGPGQGAAVAASASYQAGSVKLRIPAALLSAPASAFPLYVDPNYSETSAWAGYGEIQANYPTTNELNDTFDGNVSVGYDGGGVDRGDYVFGLPPAADTGAVTIASATLTGTVVKTYSNSSTSHTINASSVTQYSSTSTWDNPPAVIAGPSAQTFTTTSTAPDQNVSWNAASWLQNAYNGGAFQMSVQLQNSDETDSGPFVEFGRYPTLTFTYSQPAPSVPIGTGPVPNATLLSFPISDKVSLQVNVGSGNALVTTSDITVPEADGGLTLGDDYNSLLVNSAVDEGADRNGWRQREGVDVRLYLGGNGTITLLGEDGTAGTFSAPSGSGTTYGSPPVFHATLSSAPASSCSGSTYQLTWHSSGEIMCFNGAGLLTSQADRNGNTTAFSYNGSGQETQVTYTPKGASSPNETVTATYTGSDLTGLSESGGSAGTKTVTYGINGNGDLTSVQQPDGTTITLGYDGSHDLTSIKNGAGATTTLIYNSSRQVTAVAQSYGSGASTATTRLSYVSSTETLVATPTTNQSEPVSSVPDTTYTINSQDLVTATKDPQGDTRTASYTPFDDVQTSTNGLTGTTTNTYGSNGGESLTASQSPTGATTKLAYANSDTGTDPTAQYLPSSSTDAQGNATAYLYNGAGNGLSSTSALAAKSQVSYNADGTPENSTDPDGGMTSYSYNSLHQLTTVTPPTSGSLKPVTLIYDGFGRVATVTDGDGSTVAYTYDLADRITKEAYTGGSRTLTVSYAYDGAGNLKTQTDASGTTSYTYDERNQVLTKNASSGGGTLTYNYDADGNMTSAKDAGGTTTYAYNDLDQLSSLTDEAGRLWEFLYNPAGQRTTTWFNTNPTESTWAGKISDTFDASGRITRIQAYNEETPSDVVSDVSYYYTANSAAATTCGSTPPTGDTSLVQYSVNKVTSVTSIYCYDGGDRLKKVTNDNGTTYSYSYDNDGNVEAGPVYGSLAYNTSNQITTSGFGYDGDGNLTTDPANGALTYNDAGQLISASNAAGGGSSGGSESFSYAGAGQDQLLSDGSATGITYGRAGQDGQPWIDSYTSGGAANYIIRDQQGDPLGMVRGSTSYMFATDDVGSVTAIVDQCGCTDATYDYTPYGTIAAKYPDNGGNLVNENLIGYTGSLTDAFANGTTGHILDGARWYDPSTGNFTTQDADSYLGSPSNGNRYAYAADNPANYTDPTGHVSLDDLFDLSDLWNELNASTPEEGESVFWGAAAGILVGGFCTGVLAFADVPTAGAASIIGEVGCTGLGALVDKEIG